MSYRTRDSYHRTILRRAALFFVALLICAIRDGGWLK